MEVPTYQKLLAQQYEENARNLLVFQKEYEEDDVDHHEEQEYENQELADQDEFNKFHGDRGTEKMVIPTKDFEDKTRNSVRYDKDVQTHIVDIDSRFRAYPKTNYPAFTSLIPGGPLNTFPPSNVGDFLFRLPRIIKNVITAKITSISFPNVFYTFSFDRENTYFDVYDENGTKIIAVGDTHSVLIDDGSYKAVADLVSVLNTKMTSGAFTGLGFTVTYDDKANKIKISRFTSNINLPAKSFGLDFTPATIREPFNNGMGYNLGYEQFKYGTAPYDSTKEPTPVSLVNVTSLLGQTFEARPETFPDILGDPYVYIAISDFSVIEHQNFKQSYFPVFAKLLLPHNTKNQLITDIDLLNLVQRQYNFLQPVNIDKLKITIYDPYGNVIDMKGANFSFTLQLEEILNPALYEKLRDL